MATLERIAPAGIMSPVPLTLISGYEAASQTFKAGDPVDLASGLVQLSVAAGNNLGANDDPWGIALADASGTTNARIPLLKITPGLRMWLPVYHATPASAVTALAQIGTAYEIRFHTGNILCVDIGSTSNTKGWITDIVKQTQMPIGTQYGWVEFEWDFAQTAGPGA